MKDISLPILVLWPIFIVNFYMEKMILLKDLKF